MLNGASEVYANNFADNSGVQALLMGIRYHQWKNPPQFVKNLEFG